jgi:hypothetical protein
MRSLVANVSGKFDLTNIENLEDLFPPMKMKMTQLETTKT